MALVVFLRGINVGGIKLCSIYNPDSKLIEDGREHLAGL